MGIEVLPPDVLTEPPRVHRRGRRDPLRPAGGQERRPGRHRIDHRRARGGRAVPLADRFLHPDRPAAVQPQGARGADQGRRARVDGARGAAPARARRRDRRGPGDPARPDHRPDLALRHDRGRRRGLRAAAAGGHRGPDARAAALGEGAARAVPLGAPDGRGRRAGRTVRERLLGRPEGRVARRAADRRRRDRDRRADRRDEAERHDGDRDDRGPAGHDRGGRVPAPVRDHAGRPGATARSC